jgi:hypothetical protein
MKAAKVEKKNEWEKPQIYEFLFPLKVCTGFIFIYKNLISAQKYGMNVISSRWRCHKVKIGSRNHFKFTAKTRFYGLSV